MNSRQFRRWLAKQGCTFEPGKGGHLIVLRAGRVSALPMHGGRRQLGKGVTERIKKDLGLRQGAPEPRAENAMYTYPVVLEPDDNDTVMVTFPDVPGAVTFGDDEDEALLRAVDALKTVFIAYIGDRHDIPKPSRPRRNQRTVTLPSISAAKVALYESMREQGVRKADLARRLDCDFRQVDRLLDLRHHSRLDHIDAALAALGKRLEIRLHDAA